MPSVSNKVCECGTIKTRNYSTYYDTPDGCDVKTKVMVTTRYGVLAGLIISTYDVMMYSQAVGFSRIMQRYCLHTLPLAMMGATFAAVANGVQHIRRKDDGLNYFLGGLACGPILAHYLGSKHAVLLGGLGLGAIAYVKKTGVDNGWTFIPHIQPHMGTINSWRHDWTLAKDPKNELMDPRCKDAKFK